MAQPVVRSVGSRTVSVSPDGDAARLVIGEVVLGVYLAFLARATYSVWWPIVAHTCAGLVVIW